MCTSWLVHVNTCISTEWPTAVGTQTVPECPVEVITDPVHYISVCSWSTGYWAVPTISNATIHVACKERFKASIQLEPVLIHVVC